MRTREKFIRSAQPKEGNGRPWVGDVAEATSLEEAAAAMNRIGSRKRRERNEAREREKADAAKAKVTLPGGSALADWLRKA